MEKKMEKLKEVNKTLAKRLNDLETYIFVENITNVVNKKTKENTQEVGFELK